MERWRRRQSHNVTSLDGFLLGGSGKVGGLGVPSDRDIVVDLMRRSSSVLWIGGVGRFAMSFREIDFRSAEEKNLRVGIKFCLGHQKSDVRFRLAARTCKIRLKLVSSFKVWSRP